MAQQKRPLNGSSVWPLAVPVAPGVTLHTLDNTSTNLGGPFIDQLTIVISNVAATDTLVEVTVGAPSAASAVTSTRPGPGTKRRSW